ncbi:MAG: asparagine synthase [Chitinophagaceae bacterium]|nr:asparagine synthase [Chitinophagaceae bacterium]
MSRIAGLIGLQSNNELLDKILKSVKTDDSWGSKTITSSNSYLGIISQDTSVCNKSEDISVVVDGFVYNYKPTNSENLVEYIVRQFRKFGFEKTICELNGDFVIALYDNTEKTLWIARDRVGVKPLYYAKTNDSFVFASRLRSILDTRWVTSEPDPAFVGRFAGGHYRYIDNIPTSSPYKKIQQLPAAHILRLKDNEIRIWPFWKLEQTEDFQKTENELAEEYRALLSDAVNIRFATAHKPAFTLSGGMDSSSVLASAVKQTGNKQHAFSSVYVDKTYDESDEIASMLNSCVEEWHKVVLDNKPDVFANVKKMIAVNDEPVATATWLSHFLLCDEVKKQGFGSLFGGLGGDELNAGEYEYFFFRFADLIKSGKKEAFLHEVEKWAEYHDHPVFKKNLMVAEESVKRMADLTQEGICLPDLKRMSKYAGTVNADYFNFAAFTPEMVHPFNSYLKNRTYQDIFFETAPCCLRAEDRQTLAFGLDNYVPFFDYRLLEFMFKVPGKLKIRNGVTKILLREAMKGVLPEETRSRVKKTGWNAPAHMWFSGKGLEELADMVHSQQFRNRGIYNIIEVDKIISEHEEIVRTGVAKENHMMFLWQLVNLELWMQNFS